jgi:hypothetical protein
MRLGNARAINALLGQQRLSLHLSHMAHKEPRDMWLRQSPLSEESRFGAAGRMATPEPSSTERQGLEPRDTWQHWSPPR